MKGIYPFDGIRVVDFSQGMMGPLAAQMLGDMGAEVIKVERLEGEAMRKGIPLGMDELLEGREKLPDSTIWLANNRNKKSIAIDLRKKKGMEVALRLIKGSDVLIESFRPGVMEKLGLGYEKVSELNPKIVYCSISGYGESGPRRRWAGGDMWAQAMSGMVSLGGEEGDPPYMVPCQVVDHAGAALVAFAVASGLILRGKTGEPQKVMVNSLGTAMFLQTPEISTFLMEGRVVKKVGRGWGLVPPPYGPFRAKDGEVLTIMGSGSQWPLFCKAIGREDLVDDPRFSTDEARIKNRKEFYLLMDEIFSKRTRKEWQKRFREVGLRCDPCLTHDELISDPQVKENNMVMEVEHPVKGKLKMLSPPVIFQGMEKPRSNSPPLLGQHTKEVLQSIGYSEEEIEELTRDKVIKLLER